jgi:hypothetical protein
MQLPQTKARSCRSSVIGARLEKEILALRGIGARLEEAVADLTRPVPPLCGRELSPAPPKHRERPAAHRMNLRS